MKLFKKAQTATEYMIILAVIIIIALIVVGVMGGIPGLGGSTRGRASSAYWQTADIGIVAYSIVNTTGNITDDKVIMSIRNNRRDSIRVHNISLDGTSFRWTGFTLAPGETYQISETETNITECTSPGNSFTVAVEINYTDDETGASYSFNGEGNKLEGTCASS